MPTFLTIPPDAAFETVRRQLSRQNHRHIVLELPPDWTELDSLARMRLLLRQAQVQRIDVALVTRHEPVRKSARIAGIPTYTRRQDVPGDSFAMHPIAPLVNSKRPDAGLPEAPAWRRGEIVERASRPSERQARRRRITLEEAGALWARQPWPWWLRLTANALMALLIVGMLAAFALNILPAATITLTPGLEQSAGTVQITADPTLNAADIEAGVVPGRLVEVTLERSGAIAATGSQQKPIDNAVGGVVFNNLGASPVDIPVGAVVGTSTGTPIEFRTTQPATLPGGVGTRVTVPIEALQPGVAGNVRANTINTVGGALRFRVRASNPEATYGGGSSLVRVVTQQDKDTLLAQTQATVEAQAFEALQAELEPGEWLPSESVQIFTVAQAFDKFNDDEGDEVSLTLRSLIQGTALGQEDIEDVMLAALRDDVPERGLLVADSVKFERVSGITAIGRGVAFTMTATAGRRSLTRRGGTSDYGALVVGDCARNLPRSRLAAVTAAVRQPHPNTRGLPEFDRDAMTIPAPAELSPSQASLHKAQQAPGKLVALDVGLARIGVAVCDPLRLSVRPLVMITRGSRREDFARLAALIEEQEGVAVVCGLPLNMDGSESDQTRSVRKWAMRLAHALRVLLGRPLPIVFWDERLSTYAAQQILAGGDSQSGEDAVAAAVILRSYLDNQDTKDHPDFGRIELPPKA